MKHTGIVYCDTCNQMCVDEEEEIIVIRNEFFELCHLCTDKLYNDLKK